MWKALKTESILCMCNLCSPLVPEHAGSVHFKLQPYGSWPLSDSPSYVTKVCAALLSHVVAYLFKRAMSPNKSNSCSFGDTNISIMTSVFCLHLHNQRGEKETERGRQRMAVACCGFCVGAAALEAAEQWSVWWNRLRSEQTALNGNVWFGLGCLWTDGTALQRGKFNKRRSEKLETERGRERKTDRMHLYFIPGWFESLRNKRITLDGLNVLYPSHLLLQRSSLWNTCNTDRRYEQKHTHTCTQTDTCVSANPCHVLKGTRFHVDWAMALYNALWHIQYQISDIPLF